MGLDMYLSRKTYIGAEYEHRKVVAAIAIVINGKKVNIDPSKLRDVNERIGYWRKANAIHAWFVKNVQGGVDECQEAEVTFEQLTKLKKLCKAVLKSRDPTLLPPTAGFFFGSTEVDEGYFQDLLDTVKILDAVSKPSEDKDDVTFTYQSSW